MAHNWSLLLSIKSSIM